MASDIGSFVVLNGSRLSRAFLSRRVLRSRSPSIQAARFAPHLSSGRHLRPRRPRRGFVHLLAARSRALSTCLAHRGRALARVPHHDFYGPARRNTGSAAEVPFNLPNPDLRDAPLASWNAHFRYTVGSTATRNSPKTLVNPFELTPEMTWRA
jgi:hypothetical protein